MLLGGMAGHARQPEGASTISNLLGQSGGLGNIGGMLGGLFGGSGGGGGISGMLGNLLGQHEDTVQNGVQQASGLNDDQTKKLLMILAPLALAAVAHFRSQNQQSATGAQAGAESGGAADLDGNGIPDVLEQQAREAQSQSNSHVGGLIGKILDLARAPGPLTRCPRARVAVCRRYPLLFAAL